VIHLKKLALLFLTLWAVGAMGLVFAQEQLVTSMEEKHPMIFELKDRIQNQRERIAQGLLNNTLTSDQATACRSVLHSVENQMETDYQANGSQKSLELNREQYMALNTMLDSNSTRIHEMKQYFYYYDPYFDNYNGVKSYPDSATPVVPATQIDHPMIFEIQDRINHQRDRIDQGYGDREISEKQASVCNGVLGSIEKKLKDYDKAPGTTKRRSLTKEQYVALNTMLDKNSIVIHEKKQFFYYYGPFYDQYQF
jgi:hypothetical protein